MPNPTKPDSISVGGKIVSTRDFSEALWCLLAQDHYEVEYEPSVDLTKDIRSHFSVDVVLTILRKTGEMWGTVENDVLGLVQSRDGQTQIVYWVSDVSESVNLLVAQSGETFPSMITRLMRHVGANLCQISGTDIFNKRPDCLTKDDFAAVIDQLITDGEIGWADVDGGVATTVEFLNKHYRE
jgi:hypothetical protein